MLFDAKEMMKKGLPPFYPQWGRFGHAISWVYVAGVEYWEDA